MSKILETALKAIAGLYPTRWVRGEVTEAGDMDNAGPKCREIARLALGQEEWR